MKLRKILISSLLGLFLTSLAQAGELDYFALSTDELLKAEVVSASRRKEKIVDTAAAVYVITQEDIQRSGVTNIPEALRMAPGVHVARADGNSWAISIRGFNGILANKILVMMDGRTIYNPLFAGTYWELQDYVLQDIERIEVIRGPGGALWGANAVNGIINIITRTAHDTQGGLAVAEYGTNTQGTVSARYGAHMGDDGSFRVYGKNASHNAMRTTGGEDAPDEWRNTRGGFRADWGDRFTLQGDAYQAVNEQLNSIPTLAAPFSVIEKETVAAKGANILGRWKIEMANGGLLTTQAFFDYTYRDQRLLKDERGIFDIETQYNVPRMGRHEWVAGGGYRYIYDDIPDTPVATFYPGSRQDSLFNVFAQDKITLVPDRWFLTLGTKLEHNDLTGFEVQPNARVQFHPDSSQMVWGSISRAVRTPSRYEHDLALRLGVIAPGIPVDLYPNKDLETEDLIAYEVGYKKQIRPDLSVDLTAFYNDYDNLIAIGFPTAVPGTLPINFINASEAETYGFETSAVWNASNKLKFTLNYSYLDIIMHSPYSPLINQDTEEDSAPSHQVGLRAAWNITPAVTLDSALYYVSELEQSNVDGYTKLDLNLGWQINDNVRFNLIGQNLLDDSHREFNSPGTLNAAEIERAVFGKLTWRF